MRNADFDEQTSLSTSVYWLKAIIFQGARVLDSAKQTTAHINSANYNKTMNMEEQFFLTACRKAERWIAHMKLTTPEAVRFSELSENLKDVRDEREHDDERYGLGKQFDLSIDPHIHADRGHIFKKGRTKGRKFRMKRANTDGPVTVHVSASVTDLSGGRHLLGGTVDVQEVIDVAEKLLAPLLEEQHAYWDKRVARGPFSIEEASEVAESYYIEPRF